MYRALVIFGPPGSGKGTMGKVICELGKIFHLSSGDMFRGMNPHTELGQEVSAILRSGKLVSDDLTIRLLKAHIEASVGAGKYREGDWMLLDGVPRTVPQVALLRDLVKVSWIINLEVPNNEVLINRIMGRAKIEGRADDIDPEVLRERFRIYETETALVLKEYPQNQIITINADQTPLMVMRDILNQIAIKLL